MAVQEGLTSIRVSWSPPTPLGDTTGYRIYYSDGSSEDVSGGSTDNYLLTGLQNGDSYTISILATSQHFFSDIFAFQEVTLSKTKRKCMEIIIMMSLHCLPVPLPGQPSISGVTTITATSISVSWSVPSGSVVTSSEVMWLVFSSGGGSGSTTKADGSGTSGSIASTSYTIQELESGTNYSITVTVANAAGSTVSHPFIISSKTSLYMVPCTYNNIGLARLGRVLSHASTSVTYHLQAPPWQSGSVLARRARGRGFESQRWS